MTDDYPPVSDPVSSESRGWAAAAHLVPLVGFGFVAPLVIWLMRRDTDPYTEYHARDALNFQISFLIYLIASFVLLFAIIGFVLLPIVAIWGFVVMIIAGVKAANGEFYRYPLIFRFVTG
ncbi:MAG: DUF4870 domain-containing protein [Actinomycetota bacterium]